MESLRFVKTAKTIQYSLTPPDDRIERKRFSGVEGQQIPLPKEFPMSVCVSMDVPAPALIQVPTGSQEDVEHPSQVSSQHGSPGPWITRALPNGGHWGSSKADPPTGD
ncbi:hypothetical protein DUI87_25806 [Hirundo rustica rustica]|uniref:Uncharacterized protein n=1 Tax=Hirundo rustica rustica TaxID=333673 RepID=A0A3M0J9N7_HIRRU|nr:hypothetical protein DUI87_25806 [Hirundo rustica rustica]